MSTHKVDINPTSNSHELKRSKVWEFLKDIGPILVGLTAVLGSIWSGNLDRQEREAERQKGEVQQEFNVRLEIARRMIGACLKIDDDIREVEDVARQGLNTEADEAEGRLSSDMEAFDQAYGESVLLFESSVVSQFSPVRKAISEIDFPRTESSQDLRQDVNLFTESVKNYHAREDQLLTELRTLFNRGSDVPKSG